MSWYRRLRSSLRSLRTDHIIYGHIGEYSDSLHLRHYFGCKFDVAHIGLSCSFGLVVGYSGETACSALENKDCNVLQCVANRFYILCQEPLQLPGQDFAGRHVCKSQRGLHDRRGWISWQGECRFSIGSSLVHHGFSHDHPSIP